MAVFYTYKTTMEEEKMTFLKCLYHDIRNGQAIRLRKQGDDVSQYSTFVLHDLAATGTDMASGLRPVFSITAAFSLISTAMQWILKE